jgi:hypothetical protein
MPSSRRSFVSDVSTIGLLSCLLPTIGESQSTSPAVASDEAEYPHVASDFWNGFYDSVNPLSSKYGQKDELGGPESRIADPSTLTQYLQYKSDEQTLRYASDIAEDELLDHNGDVAVSIALSQYWLDAADHSGDPSQFRVDVTQINPLRNILSPLAWAAIASLKPNEAGKITLDELGFKSPEAMDGTKKMLLTDGAGKLAVNISRAPKTSKFVAVLEFVLKNANLAVPLLALPAASTAAINTFTEVMAYWEERTRFIMSSNLTWAVATKQAKADQSNAAQQIGLISGDYLMVPAKYTTQLAPLLPNLKIDQGYLVRKDANANMPVDQRAEASLEGTPIAYATMRISVSALESSAATPPSPSAAPTPSSPKKPAASGSKAKS